jgi:molybdate transport system substrate-binding protein
MKVRSLARSLASLGVVALSVPGSASAAEVHVMISAAFYEVYAELGPAFERATGNHLVTTRGLQRATLRRRFRPASREARPRTS